MSIENTFDISQSSYGPNVTAHRTSYDLYRRHLATKGRGLPLWIPEPNMSLPIEYQRQGISVGDVGILTDAGRFVRLFNILSTNDSFNPAIMPEGFKPFQLEQSDKSVERELKENSYLSSPSHLQPEPKEGGVNLIFKLWKAGGAILTMPLGAKTETLTCISRLRKYVNENLASWYRFVCLDRGMAIQNGDLRVVIGCEKTSAWGIACMSLDDSPALVSDSPTDSGDPRFYLEFGPIASDYADGGRYEWAYSGEVMDVRVGPDECEVDPLRTTVGDRARQQHPKEYFDNQCLFLRTMDPVLPEKMWEGLMLEEVYPADLMSLSDHSSIAIGKFLLKNCSEKVTMAVSLDQDWISVLREGDVILPSSEELLERILKHCWICEEGVVFFNSKYQRETSSAASVVTDQDENESYNTRRTTKENAPLNSEDVGEREEIQENPSLIFEGFPDDNYSRSHSRSDNRQTRSDFYVESNPFKESSKARSNVPNSSPLEDTFDNVRDRSNTPRSHSCSSNHRSAGAKCKPDDAMSPPPTNSKPPRRTYSGRYKASLRYASDDLDEDEEETEEDDQPDPYDQDPDLANPVATRRPSKKPELETKEETKKNFLEHNINRQDALESRQRKRAYHAQLQARAEYLAQENERLTTALISSREEISRLSALVSGSRAGVIEPMPADSHASSQPPSTNVSLSRKSTAVSAGEGAMDVDPISK